ncbi:MAG: hypothetical protein HY680_05890 [Chloroflexi bacterium]|nr:hypothetical protein [Chloroflexota bacterium]
MTFREQAAPSPRGQRVHISRFCSTISRILVEEHSMALGFGTLPKRSARTRAPRWPDLLAGLSRLRVKLATPLLPLYAEDKKLAQRILVH